MAHPNAHEKNSLLCIGSDQPEVFWRSASSQALAPIFQRIPSEIRLTIYEFALGETIAWTVRKVRPSGTWFGVVLGDHEEAPTYPESQGLIGFMQTCQKAYNEAAKVVWSCTCIEGDTLNAILKRMPLRVRNNIRFMETHEAMNTRGEYVALEDLQLAQAGQTQQTDGEATTMLMVLNEVSNEWIETWTIINSMAKLKMLQCAFLVVSSIDETQLRALLKPILPLVEKSKVYIQLKVKSSLTFGEVPGARLGVQVWEWSGKLVRDPGYLIQSPSLLGRGKTGTQERKRIMSSFYV